MAFRVLLVDDSALVRKVVSDTLESVENVEVCGEARNGQEALDQYEKLKPDLIILDVEMPVVDGITFLKKAKERGIRVQTLMLSAHTQVGADTTFIALELGATDFVPKPAVGSGLSIRQIENLIVEKVTGLMQAKVEASSSFQKRESNRKNRIGGYSILVIGSSTGGPQALHQILQRLPASFPAPILIVQHMPPVFTAAFAERLNQISPLQVQEARHGDTVAPGMVFVAPGDWHMRLEKDHILLGDDAPVSSHRPSIDVTLNSVISEMQQKTAALIMTGMGRDGVDGMIRLNSVGGYAMAQDEKSSVVFGMNRRAIESGAIDRIASLEEIPQIILEVFQASG